jgi:hypothetical protein
MLTSLWLDFIDWKLCYFKYKESFIV